MNQHRSPHLNEKPILFSAPMVRAILADEKTVTRRLLKPQPAMQHFTPMEDVDGRIGAAFTVDGIRDGASVEQYWLKYQPGDILWVRETWTPAEPGPLRQGMAIAYRADYANDPHGYDGEKSPEGRYRTWKPSIHMPRWASRITLKVKSVRVERLHAITEEDAIAEGIEVRQGDGAGPGAGYKWNGPGYWGGGIGDFGRTYHVPKDGKCCCNVGMKSAAVCAFRELWESINGPNSWESNPFISRIEFERVN